MSESFKYDVFISHSSKDKPAARELAERLRKDGLRVWFDEWEIKPGDPILLKIEEGLEQSRTLVLAMSANAFASEWVTLERHTAMFRDPTNQLRRFIPLRLDDAKIKDTLRQFAYVDWLQRSNDEYAKLLASCRPTANVNEHAIENRAQLNQSGIFKANSAEVFGVAVTPDGRRIVSGSDDRTVRVWEIDSGKCLVTLKGHTSIVYGVAVTPDGRRIVSGSDDETVRVWEIDSGKCLVTLKGHGDKVNGIGITPDGRRIVSGSDDETVRVWEIDSGKCLVTLKGHGDKVNGVSVTPDNRYIISGSDDCTLRMWEIDSGKCRAILKGHDQWVRGVAVSPEGRHIVSGSWDQTVRVWEMDSGRCLTTLEGHTDNVWGVVVTPDGRFIISSSGDATIRVWNMDSGNLLATLEGHTNNVRGVAVTPDGQYIISGSRDGTLRVWNTPALAPTPIQESEASRYTNAKILLVGDSGVGKSGLALRLTEDRFEPTISTDGAMVTRAAVEWATQLKLPHKAGTSDIEREIWLWDFAGQSDYRLIHQLFMDETALAVLIFNPQNENLFESLGQWDNDIVKAARRKFSKLLVAGRCDRGGLMVSRGNVERFGRERGFACYLETSALTGEGCDDLRAAIINNIAWDEIPWTSSPHIFRLLKGEIVKLKDEGKTLLRMSELKQQLEMRLLQQALQDDDDSRGRPSDFWQKFAGQGQQQSDATLPETFTPEQLRAVVGLLAGPGVVWQLEFGNFVLFQPERINAYAAAVIRTVRAHTDEIGCIAEARVLTGDLDYQDMKRLPHDEEQIVLRAMHQTFIDHGLCLREHTEAGTLLVFPSYFRRERPVQEEHPFPLVTYQFNGMLEEIYATLVVRLHHTTMFEKDQLWRFAADFKTLAGQRVGLKMTRKAEGSGEITIYCDPEIPVETKTAFILYVHEYLKSKDSMVKRERHYVCGNCRMPVENRRAVQARLERGLVDIACSNCEWRVLIVDLIEEKFASDEIERYVRKLERQARRVIDNESRELILVGHAFAIAGEAGQIFRPIPNSDWGIDGEIEFKNDKGEASGRRVYLQLKSGDSYLESRKDGREIFKIKNPRHAEYWQSHEYPVMLVIRTSDSVIRWMNVSEYLKRQAKAVKQVVFDGEPFTAQSVWRMRDKILM